MSPTPARRPRARSAAADDDGHRRGILLVAGDGMLTTFPLVREEVIIGRATDCDVRIAHATLSRRHARLRLGSAG